MRNFYHYAIMLAICAILVNGCAAVLVGAGGTALWQHGKIVSEEPKTLAETHTAAKEALKAKKIIINDEVKRDNFVQIRGANPDNDKVAVDIIETSSNASRIEIRIGMGQKQAARDLLLEIKNHLYDQKKFKLF